MGKGAKRERRENGTGELAAGPWKKGLEPARMPPPMPAGTAAEREASAEVLERLWLVVMARRHADPAVSHSARLLSRGFRRSRRSSARKRWSA